MQPVADDLMNCDANSSARSALRMATRAVHDRLHKSSAFAPIQAGTIDIKSYQGLLLQLFGFHKPLQNALMSGAVRFGNEVTVRIAARRRADRLSDDLMALGCSEATIAAGLRAKVPVIRSSGHMLGCLYVREGATIGGRVLARKLDALLGPGTHGRQFLAGTAEDNAMWAATCAEIERAADVDGLDDMVEGAYATFAAFETWIEGGSAADIVGSRT